MLTFLYDLKGQATILNGLIVLLVMGVIFYKYQQTKTALFFTGLSIIIFFACSTAWLPGYLVGRMEQKYLPLTLPFDRIDSQKVLIHVLGSGYVLDKRLPANAQIGLVALGRLAEGIRIYRSVPGSTLICSGYSPLGLETQAQVTKRAAMLLGVDENNIETLNTPRTTLEEAQALANRFNKSCRLILVTDALHMPRAIKFFTAAGFTPTPAPTNYKINQGPEQEGLKWWPSLGNIGLMNMVIHEWLGNLKTTL